MVMGARSQRSELMPIITLTGIDGKTRSAEYEALQTSASKMVSKAGRDVVQGEQVLNATLQDTFTTRAMWAMIAEAEKYMKAGDNDGLVPEGWAPALLSLINKAETQIIDAKANARRTTAKVRFLAVPPTDRVQCHKAPPRFVAELQRSLSDNSGTLRELAAEDMARYLVPYFRALAELQIEIQALLSVVKAEQMRIEALRRPKTSDAAFASVLAEEGDILTTVQDQISDLYGVPDGMGEAWGEVALVQKLEALPAQLQVVFDMSIWEREQESRTATIDEKTMHSIVQENQNRTEIIRNIQSILADKQDIRREMSAIRGT